MARVIKDLAVAVSTYQDNQGQTKNRYKNIGVLMESEGRDGVSQFMMLDRSFNPAGVPFKDGSDRILISMFDPRDQNDNGGGNQRSQGGNQRGNDQRGGYGGGDQGQRGNGGYGGQGNQQRGNGGQQGGGYGNQQGGGRRADVDDEIPF